MDSAESRPCSEASIISSLSLPPTVKPRIGVCVARKTASFPSRASVLNTALAEAPVQQARVGRSRLGIRDHPVDDHSPEGSGPAERVRGQRVVLTRVTAHNKGDDSIILKVS